MPPESGQKKQGLHPDVLKLGLVSFLTDLSSEMIFSVFALFFTTVAGASAALLGVIEGLADLSASSLTYLAGWLSDKTGKRKVFALTGYGFSTLSKIILLITSSVVGLGVFRVVERLGKGFRSAPRDAWLSAVTDKDSRGYAFGVHKALDKSGAVLGPLVAYGVLRLSTTVFTELREFLFARVTQRAVRQVALEVFNHLHALSLRFHLERQTGGVSRDIERGTRSISSLISYTLYSILPTLVEIGLVLGIQGLVVQIV